MECELVLREILRKGVTSTVSYWVMRLLYVSVHLISPKLKQYSYLSIEYFVLGASKMPFAESVTVVQFEEKCRSSHQLLLGTYGDKTDKNA